MSRLNRFLRTVASSYLTLLASVVYSLVSVPLVLNYLSKQEFGLWAVVTQISTYLMLFDLGMTSSVARHLIDHKDRPNDGVYGSLILTGAQVLCLQGLIIFMVGFGLAPLLGKALDIPVTLQSEFVTLLRWQCGLVAAGFTARIFMQLIYAHQRNDYVNYIQVAGFAVALFLLWVFLHKGFGLFSVIWAGIPVVVLINALYAAACVRLRLLPQRGGWGRPTWRLFRELFVFGKDLFLLTLGTQLANASQTIIITRMLGLEVAAAWAVSTRIFLFASEMIGRVFNYAEPMFSEMVVRKEISLLQTRFRDLVIATGSAAACLGALVAGCNSLFVSVWTGGRIAWSPWNDVLLGLWLAVRTVTRCHVGLNIVMKNIGFLRYIYFIEGLIFVVFALVLARVGGIPSLIGLSILCSLALTGANSARRTKGYLGYGLKEVAFRWLMPAGRMTAVFALMIAVLWWLSSPLNTLPRFALHAVVIGVTAVILFLRIGLPRNIQSEVIHRSPPGIKRILNRVLPQHT